MLTEEERRDIEEEIKHFDYKQAVSVDALKIVQKHRGWVSDESIKDIAELLEMSAAELDGVATFYNLIYRKPVGKHVILLCDSVSCWVMGCDRMREHFTKRLGINFGETSKDNEFTLLPMQCLGTCDHAPAMMIDESLHRDLNEETIDGILESYKG
jgi:NADH-quinone oxidoreductase subunit E